MKTVTRGDWGVSVTTGAGIVGAVLNVYRFRSNGRPLPGHKMIKGDAYGRPFPTQEDAFRFALERGYTQPYVIPYCRHCRVRHRSQISSRGRRTSWCPARGEFAR